jgi:hypothetical protein
VIDMYCGQKYAIVPGSICAPAMIHCVLDTFYAAMMERC